MSEVLSGEWVGLDRRGPVAVVALNRPDVRNALSVEFAQRLTATINRVAHDEAVRVIVLTGSGSSFCAGGDLEDLLLRAEQGAATVADQVYEVFQGVSRTLLSCPRPVVAAVNGPAIGAGFDLALSCDLRVASEDAYFQSAWIHLGLVPGMGGAGRLVQLVGLARASDLVLRGRTLRAGEALDIGLVSAVTSPDTLIATACELADSIARAPGGALARSKQVLQRATSFPDDFETLAAIQASLITGPEFRARAAAVLDRLAHRQPAHNSTTATSMSPEAESCTP